MRLIAICFLFLTLISCNPAQEKAPKQVYKDLKGYFESEVIRLTNKKSLVNKTIQQNGTSESKGNVSIDWKNELSLFIGSDINKPAWKDHYKIIEDSLQLSYLAIDSNLRTKEIHINKDLNGNPNRIYIKNITKNRLYESAEVLIYIPDSIYSIKKEQKVILLGNNNLFIEAKTIK